MHRGASQCAGLAVTSNRYEWFEKQADTFQEVRSYFEPQTESHTKPWHSIATRLFAGADQDRCHWCRELGHLMWNCPKKGPHRPFLYRDKQRQYNTKEFFSQERLVKGRLKEDRRVEDQDRNLRYRREWEDLKDRHADEIRALRDQHYREMRLVRQAQTEEEKEVQAQRVAQDRETRDTEPERHYYARRGGRQN